MSHPVISSILAGALLGVSALAASPPPKAPVAPVRAASPELGEWFKRPLSLADALNAAIERNATLLQARQITEAQLGIALQTRAVVLPRVVSGIDYAVRQDSLIEQNQNLSGSGVIPGLGSARSNNQSWNAEVQVLQSIYEGGRLLSALRSARLIRERAFFDYQSAVADILLQVRVAYADAQLAAAQIEVRQASVDVLGSELANVKSKLAVGVIGEFDELQAEVALSNAEPPLIAARNDFIIAKQTLVARIGYDVPKGNRTDLALTLSTALVIQTYPANLSRALSAAEARRSELAALQTEAQIGDERIVVARAGSKPSVQGFAGYDARSRSESRNAGDQLHGGTAGVQMSWPIFDGFLTKGKVEEARANRDFTRARFVETRRQIELSVRSAWSDLERARATLDSQRQNIGRAERTLKLASERYAAGAGIQLDVLNSQNALTQTRGSYVQALRDYSVAYSQLLRATGEDLHARAPR